MSESSSNSESSSHIIPKVATIFGSLILLGEGVLMVSGDDGGLLSPIVSGIFLILLGFVTFMLIGIIKGIEIKFTAPKLLTVAMFGVLFNSVFGVIAILIATITLLKID